MRDRDAVGVGVGGRQGGERRVAPGRAREPRERVARSRATLLSQRASSFAKSGSLPLSAEMSRGSASFGIR